VTTRPQARLQHCMHCRSYIYVCAHQCTPASLICRHASVNYGEFTTCVFIVMTIWAVVLYTLTSLLSLFRRSSSLSACLSLSASVCLSACLPACLSVSLVFRICFIFFVVVVVFLSLMLFLPFPSALCKLPKMFCVLFFKLFFLLFLPRCHPSHFRRSQCLFLYVLLLSLLLLWMLCLFISFYDCILPWMSWLLVVL